MVEDNKTMKDDSYVLLNLKDSKAVTNALQSDTAKNILDYLTEKDDGSTESEISKHLNLALSTVHYNIQQLKKAKLVIADEFHYSKKGKEVMHYKLAKKLIIIAPGDISDWKSILKRIIPVVGVAAVASYLVSLIKQPVTVANELMIQPEAATGTADLAEDAVAKVAPMMVEAPVTGLEPWVYFMIGAAVVLVTFIILEFFYSRR